MMGECLVLCGEGFLCMVEILVCCFNHSFRRGGDRMKGVDDVWIVEEGLGRGLLVGGGMEIGVWGAWVCGCQAGDEMTFKSIYCTLGIVSSVDMWWSDLVVDLSGG